MAKIEIAPCGLVCSNCEMYEKNGMTQMWEIVGKSVGKSADEMKCKGCRIQDGCTVHDDCATLDCIKEKGLDYCSDCSDFPCTKLQPTADMAERLPHNFKVYNLCILKKWGEDELMKKDPEIRQRYFKGKMVIGTGPVI